MNQKIVAFTGISGVGKTTFLKKLAKRMSFQHLTGGSLIAAARQADADQRDAMRHADLDENQQFLIDGFFVACDPQVELVIVDGHVVIDGGKNLTELSSTVFRALGTSLMVHLEARFRLDRSKPLARYFTLAPDSRVRDAGPASIHIPQTCGFDSS